MYSAVDSFFFVLWILTTFFFILSAEALSLSLCVSALQDIIPPITFQNSNRHMSRGETKLRDAV